jgi:RNA polymerase sigma-70 factor (ECF subfamily)
MEILDSTIERAKAGDLRAREDLLRAFAGPLRALVRRWGTSVDAEDQLQDLFAKILRVLPRFQTGGAARLSTWIFTVAHRALLEERRRPRLNFVPLDQADEVADHRSTHQALEQSQLRRKLEDAIAQLPEDQRRVILLAQIHHQPLDLIAQVEGIPIGTVKSRLHRARAQLISRLASTLDEVEGDADVVTRRA